MTTACAVTNSSGILVLPRNSGVSEGALRLEEGFRDLPKDYDHTLTIGQHYRKALGELAKAVQECSADDWDGYGARAISGTSCDNAVRFSRMLPADVPLPEVDVDPDGEVTFEWYVGPRQVFSVTIGSNDELVYAGLFGSNKTHGTEHLGDELPETVLKNIRRVLPRGVYFGAAECSRPI